MIHKSSSFIFIQHFILVIVLQPLLKKSRGLSESVDANLALRLLAELPRSFNRPLHVACSDIKSEFDSVDVSALWKALLFN